MARGDHGLPIVSHGPALPDPFMPAGWPPLKRPYNRLMDGLPAAWAACGRLLPIWKPHAIQLWLLSDGEVLRQNMERDFEVLLFLTEAFWRGVSKGVEEGLPAGGHP
jgi:hypothetical protein